MKTITITFDDSNEIYGIWLENLLEEEIKEEIGTIANEKFWLYGSATEEEEFCHSQNIEEHTEYLEVLKSAYKQLVNN